MKLTKNELLILCAGLCFAFFCSLTGTIIIASKLSKTRTQLEYRERQTDSLKAELSGLYEIIEYKDSLIK